MTSTPSDIPQINLLLQMIKLRTGEEILCTLVDEKESGLIIESPIQVKIIPVATESGNMSSQVLISRWCPYAETDSFFISNFDIMICKPMAKSAHQIYVNAVNRYNKQLIESSIMDVFDQQSLFFIDGNDTIN